MKQYFFAKIMSCLSIAAFWGSAAPADIRINFTSLRVNDCNEIGTCDWKLSCALGNQQETELIVNQEANTNESLPINRILTQSNFPPVTVTCSAWEHDGGIGAEWETIQTASVNVATTGPALIRLINASEGDVTVNFTAEAIGTTGQPLTVGSDDILWQHIGGQVHFWPITNGTRDGGFDIAGSGPVGNDWRLVGAGDFNGDGADDILWQHFGGQVHFWPVTGGARTGGLDIGASGPVGNDWRLVGAGDFNGDGTDDILWQHIGGQVHFWPILDGVRQGGADIGASGPVGNDWQLVGAGDFNGDGTDDILWQHMGGQVHYWPIRDGARQGGVDIGASGPVGNDWRLVGAGDLNADGTDDILWQHFGGQAHFWPIRDGARQGGVDIGASGPVGNDWHFVGAGNFN